MSEAAEIPPLDPVAFFIALISGPIIFTLLTFWIVFIPVFALVIGGIPYLVIGTPVLLWMALTGPVNGARSAIWAGLTNAGLTAGGVLGALIVAKPEDAGFVAMFGAFCIGFGMAWAAAFGIIYRNITDEPVKEESVT
ncbi:MAG: hypothetical protein ACRC6I_17840 [Paracoccaceae bacterium]